jgi:hypothetical protein
MRVAVCKQPTNGLFFVWAVHVAHMAERGNAQTYTILVKNPEGPLTRLRRRWEYKSSSSSFPRIGPIGPFRDSLSSQLVMFSPILSARE